MRIRKNAKVSPVLLTMDSSSSSASEGFLRTHVCQLNQSPWDVIPFAQYSRLTECEEYNSCNTGNGSGDSIGIALESVASPKDVDDDDKSGTVMVIDREETNVAIVGENEKINGEKNDNRKKAGKVANDSCFESGNLVMGQCQKNDGKGWQCKKEAKVGYNFCDHHLSLFRSYNNSNNNTVNNNAISTTTSNAKSTAASLQRNCAASGSRSTSKRPNSSNSNPYEFYYYSGFGPLWGRRRDERVDHGGGGYSGPKAEINVAVENSDSLGPSSTTATLQIDNNQGFDYVEDEDEDEEDDVVSGDSGKKQMRKPVKARSLKSLM